MIGKIIGFLFVMVLGLFAACAFIIANECDKYYDFEEYGDK